jgi:RimJ/RimL family protein N-acetyltransferase
LVQTDRLTGERPALEHLDAFAALLAEPGVAKTMWPGNLGGPRTRDQSEAWLRKDLAHWELLDYGPWFAFERDTGELVGRIGPRITIVAGVLEAELAWIVRPDRWGRGYAGELAAPARDLLFERGLRSVVAYTLVTNKASRRVMEKLGMAYERDIEHAGLPHVLYRSHRA